jgi:hypothetical protein
MDNGQAVTLTEKILYCEHAQKRYRLKVRNSSVSVERQPGQGHNGASQQAFNLGTFPVLDDKYWDMDIIGRLIQWYESDQTDIAGAFLIPNPDSAPNLNNCMILPKPYVGIEHYPSDHPGHARLLNAMFDELELPEGGYDICGCGRWGNLNADGQCANCAPIQDDYITGAPDDDLIGAIGPDQDGE